MSRPPSSPTNLLAETLEPRSNGGVTDLERTPVVVVACHPNWQRVGELALLSELGIGTQATAVAISRTQPEFMAAGSVRTGPLADPCLSRRPVRLSLDGDDLVIDARETAPLGVNGNTVTGVLRLPRTELESGVVLELAGRIVLVLRLRSPARLEPPIHGFLGVSDRIAALRREVERVAQLDIPVLIRGESGTGKELVARAIHRGSARSQQPLVCVNVAAIPPSTAAAELFGYRKGAFTGATESHPGYFGRAHLGTLFLDEIGEAPEAVQPMLLRALETGEIQPVGASAKSVDVRVLTATDVNLRGAVRAGRFRGPLLHRLSGYEIHTPPLRERPEDIGLLLYSFLRDALEQHGNPELLRAPRGAERPWLGADIVVRALAHDWPGNVRELKNFVRRLALGSCDHRHAQVPEGWLVPEPLVATQPSRNLPQSDAPQPDPPLPARNATPAPISEATLLDALRRQDWRIAPTARQLGISKNWLYRLMDRCPGIRKAKDLERDEILRCWGECDGDLQAMAVRLEVSARGLQLRMRELGVD